MDYKDWVIFKILVEEQNMTKTAERLFISQPALSYRLQNLEKELGVKILNRYSSGVGFTAEGEYLAQYAIEMLTRFEDVKEQLQSMNISAQGTIRIGFSSVVAKYKMARLVKSYRTQFPTITIQAETASSKLKLPEMLKNNQIDIAIIRGDTDWSEGKKLLSEEPMCLVFNRPITLDELPDHPWVEYESAYITHSHTKKLTWWQETIAKPVPNIVKADAIDGCLQMVSCGLGWCIVPKIHLAQHRSLFSTPIVWPSGHTMSWKTFMIYHNSIAEQPVYKTFINYVQRKYGQ